MWQTLKPVNLMLLRQSTSVLAFFKPTRIQNHNHQFKRSWVWLIKSQFVVNILCTYATHFLKTLSLVWSFFIQNFNSRCVTLWEAINPWLNVSVNLTGNVVVQLHTAGQRIRQQQSMSLNLKKTLSELDFGPTLFIVKCTCSQPCVGKMKVLRSKSCNTF